MERRGESGNGLAELLGDMHQHPTIKAEHQLLYPGIRVLGLRVKEIVQDKPEPFSENIISWAESFSAGVDLFANPPPASSQIRVRHFLDRLKSALRVYHENIAELRNRQFLRGQELERVERNRAYRGFDYSPQIRSALASIESEMRQTKFRMYNVVQDILFNILLEREKVIITQLPTDEESSDFHPHGIALSRLET